MTVKLLYNTPLWIADKAIGKCWDKPTPDIKRRPSYEKNKNIISLPLWAVEQMIIAESHAKHRDGDITPGCNIERIERVALKNKHSSTIEHLNYTYDIDGISRALLQEIVRHRHCSYSVKSTRYTLKELKTEEGFTCKDKTRAEKYLVMTGVDLVDEMSIKALENLRLVLKEGISNDIAKYCLPEAFKTSLVMTINARSLQNLLQLRTHKSALWEFRGLAKKLYEALPEEHKFLFKDFIYKEKEK